MSANLYGPAAAIEDARLKRASRATPLPVARSAWVQPALVVDGFRVVAGLLLARHYVEHTACTPAFVQLLGGSAPGEHPMPSTHSSVAWQLGVQGLRAGFALGVVLSALLALGISARASALALLAISAVTYGAVQPFVTLDDCFATALSFWLAVLPVGRTLNPLRVDRWRKWSNEYVSGYAVAGCAVFLVVLLIRVSLQREGLPPTARFGLLASAACAVAPVGIWRWLAPIPAIATLTTARAHSPLACAATISLCAVLLFSAIAAQASGPPTRPVSSFGAFDAVGAAAILLLGVEVLSRAARIGAIAQSSGAVLASAGIPQSPTTIDRKPRSAGLDIGFVSEGAAMRREGLDASNPRLQSTLHQLEISSVASERLGGTLIRRLVALHCRQAGAAGVTDWEDMMLLRSGHIAMRLARFRCEDQQVPAQFKPSRESEGGLSDEY